MLTGIQKTKHQFHDPLIIADNPIICRIKPMKPKELPSICLTNGGQLFSLGCLFFRDLFIEQIRQGNPLEELIDHPVQLVPHRLGLAALAS